MTSEELMEHLVLIQKLKCETQTLALKSGEHGCPKKLYDSLSSFSNQDEGGIIIFGVDESQDYREVGVYDAQDLQKKPLSFVTSALTDFFVYCVEMNVFDHVQTKDGKKYSNFGGFNRSGYREVEAFLRTLSNYESVQFYELEVQNDIDLTASMVYLHLVKSRTIEQEEALLFSVKFDFFSIIPDEMRKMAEYKAHKRRIEVAKQVIEAMPDFEPTNFYADIADITAVVCSVSGWEHPGERLDFEKSNEAYLIAKSTQHT